MGKAKRETKTKFLYEDLELGEAVESEEGFVYIKTDEQNMFCILGPVDDEEESQGCLFSYDYLAPIKRRVQLVVTLEDCEE